METPGLFSLLKSLISDFDSQELILISEQIPFLELKLIPFLEQIAIPRSIPITKPILIPETIPHPEPIPDSKLTQEAAPESELASESISIPATESALVSYI